MRLGTCILSSIETVSPGLTLSLTTIQALVKQGRICLVLDGLDESKIYLYPQAIKGVLDAVRDYCGDGLGGAETSYRVILTARQEIFASTDDEREVLSSVPEYRELVYTVRTRMLTDEQVSSVLRGRLGSSRATQLIEHIHTSPDSPITGIIRRPIFLHIVGETSDELVRLNGSLNVFDIFEQSVRQ